MPADVNVTRVIEALASNCINYRMTVTGTNINIIGEHALFADDHFRAWLGHSI